jgi:HK97 family phage major capsid protein
MSDENKIIEKLGQLDSQWKEVDRKREDEIKRHGEALSETKSKLGAIEAETAKLEDVLKRLDDIELKDDTPLRERDGITKAERKHLEAFDSWVRDPRNHEKAAALHAASAEVNPREKAVAGTSNAAGGYAVPEVIARRIGEKLQDISPMRGLVRVVPVGTTDYKELIDVNGETAGWVGETDTRNETNTPQLAEVAPTMGTLYAYPKATEESLDDIFFNVEDWLVRKVSVAFAKAEGSAFISGNGTNKPTGFLNGTPTSAGDEDSPARAFGTLQYIASGVSDALGSPFYSSPGLSYPQDLLIDVETALKPGYRQNARYLMNRATLALVRKWKDADGNYLWQRSMQAGQPSLLNGYPVVEMEDMPSIGANAFPIAFGDFMEGYLAVDRVGLRMTIDNITTPGYVKYYVRRRQGGKLYNDDAIKLIKCATS